MPSCLFLIVVLDVLLYVSWIKIFDPVLRQLSEQLGELCSLRIHCMLPAPGENLLTLVSGLCCIHVHANHVACLKDPRAI